MNRRTTLPPYSWIPFLLVYLVAMGFVPFFSELRSLGSLHGTNPHHNFELAWGLMHIVPALLGVAVALWYLRYSSLFPAAAVVLLTLQALFALLEYRREGFDPRLATGLEWSGYATGMFAAAVPFLAAYLIMKRRRSVSY